MLARSLTLAFVLASAPPLHAQEAPAERGPWIRYGTVAPEVQVFDVLDNEWAVGYRTASGFSLGVTATASQSDEVFPSFNPAGPPEVLAERRNSVFRRVGVLGSWERGTNAGIVRGGVNVMYSYDRDTFTGLTLQNDVYFPDGRDGEPVGITVLREDPGLRTERNQTQILIASGVSLGREVVRTSKVRFAPAAGVVLGARESLEGAPSIDRAETLAYLTLPVRLDVTRRIGVSLDATIGGKASWRSETLRARTGQNVAFSPTIGFNASVDF